MRFAEKQEECVEAILDHYMSGDEEDTEFTVEMPTGTGKSVIMSLLSQFYRARLDGRGGDGRDVLIVCTDQKDIRDTEEEYRNRLEGAVARRSLQGCRGKEHPVPVRSALRT